jgi:hypothetical protein
MLAWLGAKAVLQPYSALCSFKYFYLFDLLNLLNCKHRISIAASGADMPNSAIELLFYFVLSWGCSSFYSPPDSNTFSVSSHFWSTLQHIDIEVFLKNQSKYLDFYKYMA